jgi:MFS family permease
VGGPTDEVNRGWRASALSSFQHRDFLWFWLGALISNIGTWMQNVTVPFVVYELTKSGAWVGLAAFAGLFPGVVVGPLAGSLADRIERRKLLLWSQIVQAVLAMALWGAWEAGSRSPGFFLVLIGANGLVFGGTIPAWQAFVASLVPREELLNAVTLNSAQFNGARAVGPAIGGIALGAFGPSWAFLLNAVSFLAVIAALLAIRRQSVSNEHRESEGGLLASFATGVQYAWRHAGIFVAIALVGVVSFVATPVFQLLPVVAKRVFGVGAGLYGLLAAAFGIGAVLGAGVIGSIGSRYARSQLVKWSLLVYAAGLIALGLAPVFALGVVAVLVMGFGFVGTLAVLNTTVQILVEDRVRGRVLAVYSTLLTSLLPLGALLEGALADSVGMRTVSLMAGAVLVATGGLLIARRDIATRLDEHGLRRRFLTDTDAVIEAPGGIAVVPAEPPIG